MRDMERGKQVRFVDAVVPNASMTDVTTRDTWVDHMSFCNTTAAAITITVRDKQATPVNFLSAASIAGNSTTLITFPRKPKFFKGGFSWQASAAGLNGSLEGNRQTATGE